VRAIFALFEEKGSIALTLIEVQRRGWRLKSWARKRGQFREGGPFTVASLRRLLRNVLYTGVVRHKGQTYPGQHAAILAPGVWERVQERITSDRVLSRGLLRNKHLALLSGLLHCECCSAPMVYSYSAKNGRKYPYYVCRQAQHQGWATCPSKSLPAQAIEESVLRQMREAQIGIADASEWEQKDRTKQLATLRSVVARIGYDGRVKRISIRFHPSKLEAGQAASA
jgi:site-specific DNA recombinase